MPNSTDTRLDGSHHVVQFYGSEDEWASEVGTYLTVALIAGDPVIVIAGPSHRLALRAAAGTAVDLDAAKTSGHLVTLDAADTLAAFMIDGRPDATRFDAVVGGVVRDAAATGGRVRAYGEMVALLWEDGNIAGAIALEGMWNDLAAELPFSLFCAYPSQIVSGAEVADAFAEVCAVHSGVITTAVKTARTAKRPIRASALEISRRSLLLILLERGPRHGWGLAEDLAAATGERFDRAAVYRVLHALERDGLVSSSWKKSERAGADQREYKLTARGRGGASEGRSAIERTIVRLRSLLSR